MTVPLKKIRMGHKFRFNGVLFKVIDKRAFGTVVAKNLENPEPYRAPKYDKETPVEPAD